MISIDIREGDALEVLRTLQDESCQMCVTSPPYWGLRDYGVEGQIGLEPTPEEYVERIVAVFREVRRVLRCDGTLWLNLGDSYASTTSGIGERGGSFSSERAQWSGIPERTEIPVGLKPKDLVGIPWRVAFALQADGWYLRSDIIWAKPNPMPESVVDRPTKAHEYVFLLSKSSRYFYDAKAIMEPSIYAGKEVSLGDKPLSKGQAAGIGVAPSGNAKRKSVTVTDTRNRRSVWTIPTKPFPSAHFAVFPPAIVEPCVLAGSREGDTVLDPFAGSGTVGVVCREHQRDFVGIELNPDYARMACGRLGFDTTRLDDALPLFSVDGVYYD